jgi:hypothetical protein
MKLQLTTDKKSDFRSWKKGKYNDGFEVDWGTWTELKVASAFSTIFAARNNEQETGQSTMKFRFIHDREFAWVTEDIVKEIFTKNNSFLFRKFSQQEIKQTHNSLPSCWCSLFVKSLSADTDASFSQSKSLSQIKKP